jgi:hypothetical protein
MPAFGLFMSEFQKLVRKPDFDAPFRRSEEAVRHKIKKDVSFL